MRKVLAVVFGIVAVGAFGLLSCPADAEVYFCKAYTGGAEIESNHGKVLAGHIVHNFNSKTTNDYLAAWAYGCAPTVTVQTGAIIQISQYHLNSAFSGYPNGPIFFDPSTIIPAIANGTGFVIGGEGSIPLLMFPFPSFGDTQTRPPEPVSPTGGVMYAPEDKRPSGFPADMPTKAPPRPSVPPPRFVTFNLEAGIYGFVGGKSTINGIPGGPGITPTGADSFNFQDQFMFTTGGAIVVSVSPSWTAALTGGFAGVEKQVTFSCVTYCANGIVVPLFSDSKEVFLPGAYVGGRLQWPITLPGFPRAAFRVDYKHVFAFDENVALGGVAQGRIVNINVAQDLDIVTAGVSVPLY